MTGPMQEDETTMIGSKKEKGDDEAEKTTMTSTTTATTTTISDFLQGEGRFSLWTEVRSFFTIMSFITRLPVPVAFGDLHPGFVMKGMAYICSVGTLIGVILVVVLDVLDVTLGLPTIIAVCFMTAMNEFYLTGCFHTDGLADAADGIGGGWTTKKILQIMSDSRLGTFGCAAYCIFTMTKIHLLQALGPSQWTFLLLQQRDDAVSSSSISSSSHGAGPAIVVAQTLSRLAAPYLIRTREYIDDSTGPKTEFYSFFVQAKHLVSWPRVLASTLTCLLVAGVLYGPVVAVVLVATVLGAANVAGSYADYWLGGVMGDYLGATICCIELLCLTMLLWADLHQEFIQDNVTLEKLLAWPHDFILQQRDQETGILNRCFLHHYRTCTEFFSNDGPYSESVKALGRFLVVAILLKLWCSAVGHERIVLRDWPEVQKSLSLPKGSDKEASDDDAVNGLQRDEKATVPSSDLPPKQFAEATLASSISSFSERYYAVQSYINILAKPVGALGTLEDWAARLAALQRTIRPTADRVACLIFAADHGAAKSVENGGEACSLYPPAVTQSILQGLQRGIAGASFLAKEHHVTLRVVDVGVADGDNMPPFYDNAGGTVRSSAQKLVGGTRNLCTQAAMTMDECERCMQMGRDEFSNYVFETEASIVVLGEVGIGNTTASAALIAHFARARVENVCGAGATTASQSANDASIHKKVQLVKKALKLHGSAIKKSETPVKEALARLGGAEIAALVGAMLQAAESGSIALLIDGFICTAAALVALTMDPLACSRILFLTTISAEKGHDLSVAKIQQLVGSVKEKGQGAAFVPSPTLAAPALSMNLRMGEATAALLAVPLIRSAAAMLSEMGTIDDILATNKQSAS